MQELFAWVLWKVECVETKRINACKKWRKMRDLPGVALWQSLEIVLTVSNFLHFEWIHTIHALEGSKAFKRDLGRAGDKLKE